METLKEVETEEIIASDEPEFVENDELEISANFVVLCEEKSFKGFSSKIFEQLVCGESLADWVGRACSQKPIFLTLSESENFLDLIKPYCHSNDYTVVLFASTPLVTKSHIHDMLCFAARKRLNVCKLKKGYILKNDYISNVDEIFASLTYGLSGTEFFEVKTVDDLSFVKEILSKRMFNFHRCNGVVFDNEKLTNLHSNVHIGSGSQIGGGVELLNGTFVGENVLIQEGAIVSNSKIGDDSIIETGAVIKNSIVKNGAIIEANATINRSVVGERARVSLCSVLNSTALKTNVTVSENCFIDTADVLENAEIGKNSFVIGGKKPAVIQKNQKILPCSKILSMESVED